MARKTGVFAQTKGKKDITKYVTYEDSCSALVDMGFECVWSHEFVSEDDKRVSKKNLWVNRTLGVVARSDSYSGAFVGDDGKPTWSWKTPNEKYDPSVQVVNAVEFFWRGDCGWTPHAERKGGTRASNMPTGSGGYEVSMDGRQLTVRHSDAVNGGYSMIALFDAINKAGGFYPGDDIVHDYHETIYVGTEFYSPLRKPHARDFTPEEEEVVKDYHRRFLDSLPPDLLCFFQEREANDLHLPPNARDSAWNLSRQVSLSLEHKGKSKPSAADLKIIRKMNSFYVGSCELDDGFLSMRTSSGVNCLDLASACKNEEKSRLVFDMILSLSDDDLCEFIHGPGALAGSNICSFVRLMIDEPVNCAPQIEFFDKLSERLGSRLDLSGDAGVIDMLVNKRAFSFGRERAKLTEMLSRAEERGAKIFTHQDMDRIVVASAQYPELLPVVSRLEAERLMKKSESAARINAKGM